MSKIYLLMILLFASSSIFAQARIYVDDEGNKTDSTHATTIVYFYNKTSTDTVFRMEQYTMDGELLTSGGYLDTKLITVHGPFKYYAEIVPNGSQVGKDSTKVKNGFFLQEEGKFLNGEKEGVWTTYFDNGAKKGIKTFKNGVLNGLYVEFRNDKGEEFLSGNYLNGERDGEWKFAANPIPVLYKKGKYIKTEADKIRDKEIAKARREAEKYDVPPRPMGNFDERLKKFMASLDWSEVKRETAIILLDIAVDGKVTLKSVNGLSDTAVEQKFNEFFDNARFVPRTVGKEKTPVRSTFTYKLYF